LKVEYEADALVELAKEDPANGKKAAEVRRFL
jgi:hypothetical protein